jgi:hypothetical protein
MTKRKAPQSTKASLFLFLCLGLIRPNAKAQLSAILPHFYRNAVIAISPELAVPVACLGNRTNDLVHFERV